jgi:hypothetical protein
VRTRTFGGKPVQADFFKTELYDQGVFENK